MTAIIPTELLKERYEQGTTLRELAEQTGLSFQAVHQRLRYHGVALRPAHPRKYTARSCAVCDEVFMPRRDSQYTCSKKCNYKAQQRGKKERCKRGHLLFEDNLYPRYGKSVPRCKLCCRLRNKKSYQKVKGVENEKPS